MSARIFFTLPLVISVLFSSCDISTRDRDRKNQNLEAETDELTTRVRFKIEDDYFEKSYYVGVGYDDDGRIGANTSNNKSTWATSISFNDDANGIQFIGRLADLKVRTYHFNGGDMEDGLLQINLKPENGRKPDNIMGLFMFDASDVTLEITRVDEVGGLVEGTFSGEFKNSDDPFSSEKRVTFSHGDFTLKRVKSVC